jgi:tetratricopeptide (TPR) repeat protein
VVLKGLDGLKMYFRLSGRFEEAANHFSAAVKALGVEEENKAREQLRCRLLITAADFAVQIGEFEQAEKYLETAHDISSRENWLELRAVAEHTKGDLLYNQGKYIRANAILQKAIAHLEKGGDSIHLAESYYKLGICFWRSDRWQDTAKILTKALNISQKLEYNWAVVISLWALGYLYRDKGQRDISLEYHEKSIQLALDINFLPGVYRGYISAGLNYEDLGQFEKAMECYELALKYAQETGDQPGLIRANGCVGRIFWKLHRYEEGLSLMEETLLITRRLGFKVHIAWQLIVKAEILYAMGRYKEAWPVNEEGLMLARETRMRDRIIQSDILAIKLSVALGQMEAALNQLHEMVETAEDVFTLAAAHFQLWQITKDKEQAELALTNYRLAYTKDPYIEYKERIEILTGILG